MAIKKGKETFAGYNKPKRTPSHPKKSHAVLAKSGSQTKLIRFGQQGVSGSPKKKGESAAYKRRRESFKARHSSNIKKGVMSAAYWADKVKWQERSITMSKYVNNNPIEEPKKKVIQKTDTKKKTKTKKGK